MKNFDHVKRQLVKCAPVLLASAFVFCAATSITDITSARQGETNCDTNESEMKLFGAIAEGDSKKVESLLAEGVSPYAQAEISDDGDKRCSSALMQALRHGHKDIIKLLFKAIDRNTLSGNWNVRHYHSRFPCEEWVIKFLMSPGKDVNSLDVNGDAPLVVAAICGNLDLTRYLVENGADINRFGNTAIMRAVNSVAQGDYRNGDRAKIISILSRAGADINGTDKEGNTALMLTAAKAMEVNPVITELLSLGAKVNSRNKDGDTALIIAVKQYRGPFDQDVTDWYTRGIVETINILASAGADIDAENHSGETALKILAIRSGMGYTNILRALLAHKAEVNKTGSTGEPALILAIRSAAGRSNSIMVQVLIKSGADVNAHDYGKAPALIVAVRESGNADVVSLLLGAGARVNDKDVNGDTALIAAVREHLPTGAVAAKKALRRNIRVIRALVAASADISVKDELGFTAVDLAKKANNKEIIQLLSEADKRRK